MCEIWRPIAGWEDYEINPSGQVRTGIILQSSSAGQVRLARSRRQRSWRNVKRLIYQVFPELRPTKPARMPKQIVPPQSMRGEEFREYSSYFVSNLGRIWSKKYSRMIYKAKDVEGHQVDGRRLREIVFGYVIPTEDGEVWKEHQEYPGYAFSNYGRVYSYYRRKIISDSTNEKYFRFCFKGKNTRVHRIVAELFVQNPNHYPQVDHIDENRSNNRADNLRWCTAEQNKEYYAKNHYQ